MKQRSLRKTEYAYDTGTGLQVGSSVLLEDYFTPSDFGVWQELTIPVTDLAVGANTFDSIRMEVVSSSGTKPRWYLDDMYWQESGGVIPFVITPPSRKIFCVETVSLTFIDAYDATLLNNSMPNFSYNKILNLAKLTNGILLQRVQGEGVQFAAIITCLGDLTKGGAEMGEKYCDGTNTVLQMDINFSEPVDLDPRTLDEISITINDDLSGLISFTAVARGTTRDIE